MMYSFWCHPLVIAVLLTVLNACKPVAVDDTAYLTMARHLARHPGDPYGFDQFWYARPQPAMEVLAPPVLPYWLGLGIALFGEHEFLLKLWLFPFAALLTFSLRSLLKRFAAGTETLLLPLIGFSGIVLPLFGFMLDLPALALSLTSLEWFARGGRFQTGVSAILLALALQTKYTAIVYPSVIIWFGITNGRVWSAVVIVLGSVLLFAAWEGWLFHHYGHSHFWFHATEERPAQSLYEAKMALVSPMLSYLGGLAIGLALLASRATGWWRGMEWIIAVMALSSLTAIAVLPGYPSERVARNTMPLLGVLFLIAVGISAFRIGVRDRISRFLIGWWCLELASYFVLTPFPAGRRVIGLALVSAMIFARSISISTYSNRWPSWAILALGPFIGLTVYAIDVWDAQPEKRLAQNAQQWLAGKGGTVWFNGHWGFQYYCERAGMKPVDCDVSLLEPGDWLVFPAIPDDQGFYRPYHGGAKFKPDERFLTAVTEWTWDDALNATTIPTLYGGSYPLLGRSHPRLKVVIYRVNEAYCPERILEP
ncbi:MAG: hypothetical protein U0798_10925 [Gemmataceae bacterium]